MDLLLYLINFLSSFKLHLISYYQNDIKKSRFLFHKKNMKFIKTNYGFANLVRNEKFQDNQLTKLCKMFPLTFLLWNDFRLSLASPCTHAQVSVCNDFWFGFFPQKWPSIFISHAFFVRSLHFCGWPLDRTLHKSVIHKTSPTTTNTIATTTTTITTIHDRRMAAHTIRAG